RPAAARWPRPSVASPRPPSSSRGCGMGDSGERLRALRKHTAPPLSDGDVDRFIAGGERRLRVRRVRRAVLLGGTGCLVAFLIGWQVVAPRPTPEVAAAPLSFSDGSTATQVEPTSELGVAEASSGGTVGAGARGGR